jgi:Spy/CpxP family protein refolding chaperone
MKIKTSSKLNHPSPDMSHKLVRFLPILAVVIGAPTVASIAQAYPHQGYGQIAQGGMERHGERLNFTPEQKTKMEQLRQSTRAKIEAILTPEQLPKFKQIEARHQERAGGEHGLNLTAEQKTKMQALRQANMQKFRAVLTPAQQAQLKQDGGWGRGEMKKLNLTAEQKAKMEQLRAASRTEREAILTPAQQQQVQTMRDRHRSMGDTWKSLNLTPDQQAKMKEIRQASAEQFKAILTPEQQAKFKGGRKG